MDNTSVDAAIVVPSVVGLLYAAWQYRKVANVKMDGHMNTQLETPINRADSADDALERMTELGKIIQDGSDAFLMSEYQYLAVFVVIFIFPVYWAAGLWATVAFVIGCFTSTLAGWIGMKVATRSNYKACHECWADCGRGYAVAINGGSVMGLSLVGIGLLVLFILICVYYTMDCFSTVVDGVSSFDAEKLFEAVAGYGLGGSSIALFGRVGGGIYTKAADVGADLSGKIDHGLEEDDPRNPACIADNVGDNVGDIAGMGADLFGSFAEATCAALVIASANKPTLCMEGTDICGISDNYSAMMFPLLISASGIIGGIVTLIMVNCFYPVKKIEDVEPALKGVLVISTIIETPFVYGVAVASLPAKFFLEGHVVTPLICCYPIWLGLWSGLIIGYVTEYYTSYSYAPVRSISKSQETSAATGIIFGLAVGYNSCTVPTLCLAVTILVAHSLIGMYGVALGALGMLSTMTMGLTIDAYGPISDNAGGIAEMAGLSMDVRKITDGLDAAGNTTAAIGKGFAIGSAALVSLALFGAYCVRAKVTTVNCLDPWTFTGLLLGAMIPYAFSAMTMRSVGNAAADMVEECRRQFKDILPPNCGKPDYERCIKISTEASLKEMIPPGLLVILSPIIVGMAFGKNCTAGLLMGDLVSGVQMAISMSNTGGAWDNAKKYIEKCNMKGTETHKNAVIGDTVGDPLKDTSGPSINIVMKLSAIVSLVFGTFICDWSNQQGGPFWLA